MLHILCLWDTTFEDFETFQVPLVSILEATANVKIFFANLHTDDWQNIYQINSINAFILVSSHQNSSADCLPKNFAGPVCILDLTHISTSAHVQPFLQQDSPISQRQGLKDVYRFTPPFSLGVLLDTLRKSLLSFPHPNAPDFLSSQTQHIIFYQPHKRCIRHPEGGEIFLTEKEVAILDFLIEKAPQKLTKKAILEAVWGYLPHTVLNTHTLETHIYYLRQKFEGHGLISIILSDHEGYAFNGISDRG